MRAIIQRVTKSEVSIEGKIKSKINAGLLVLIGIEDSDNQEDIDWLAGKIVRLRIFDDKNGIMNLSVCEADGEIMVVSQFTLHASTKKGNRPSYIRASKPDVAIPLYNAFIKSMEVESNKTINTGEFGAMMQINLVNNGPVTIYIDTKNRV